MHRHSSAKMKRRRRAKKYLENMPEITLEQVKERITFAELKLETPEEDSTLWNTILKRLKEKKEEWEREI